MRHSPLRHTLAVLRTTIGLTQKEMAELIGRSTRTIQAIELGQLSLGEDLALRIGEATGVDVNWLLDGNPDVPPVRGVTALGLGFKIGNYTKKDFEAHRAFIETPAASNGEAEAFQAKPTKSKASYATMPLPVAKAVMLREGKQRLTTSDKQLTAAVAEALSQTALMEGGLLVRWRIRQLLKTLAAEHSLKLQLLAPKPDPAQKYLQRTKSPSHS
jgi:transcriptional regulator with XRE-family HTH domain